MEKRFFVEVDDCNYIYFEDQYLLYDDDLKDFYSTAKEWAERGDIQGLKPMTVESFWESKAFGEETFEYAIDEVAFYHVLDDDQYNYFSEIKGIDKQLDYLADKWTIEDYRDEIEDRVIYNAENEEILNYLNYIGFDAGTVGYSPWSYYLASPMYGDDYINDLWNGYNFYDLFLYDLEKGLDDYDCVIVQVYAPSLYDLRCEIATHFGLKDDEYMLGGSSYSFKYWDIEKFEKVPGSYKLVQVGQEG